MLTLALLKGIVLGFSIAAPVGPIGILCIRRTLAEGMRYGLVTGIGTAVADSIYGLIAAFGITLVTDVLLVNQFWLRLGGGLFLCYLGIKIFVASPGEVEARKAGRGLIGAFISAFFLTLTNPMTIISFAAVFAGIGIDTPKEGHFGALLLVLGVFVGSSTWWLILSGSVSLLRNGLDQGKLRMVNRLAGLIILTFGAACLWSIH